jgi:predicted acetyltransferase
LAWQAAFVDMARDWEAAGEERHALALSNFAAYLEKVERRCRGDGAEPGRVPGREFWLENDGQIVACVRLRLQLTEDLLAEGGHIGYDVRPSMRRCGYGTALLRLALVEARNHGITRVRITCDADNIASQKVIERNGGVFSDAGISDESGKLVRRFWIEQPAQL